MTSSCDLHFSDSRDSHGKEKKKEKERTTRKRSRASKKTPTTVLNTDPTNFRAMVQRFTGLPLFYQASAAATLAASYEDNKNSNLLLTKPLPRRAFHHQNTLQFQTNFLEFTSANSLQQSQLSPGASDEFLKNYFLATNEGLSQSYQMRASDRLQHANGEFAPTVWDEMLLGTDHQLPNVSSTSSFPVAPMDSS